eukprot:CAMPEP_0194253922 /NCGR_PEP_ID=MMETSP0158-20130606/30932_1 /TAXON_ID=33649 /ORGANISM="Thalassionema nitzschioides, Strain L26-B" /LENGTH=493 /DNA_ID=CAMNT_0038991775 /DNA_START=30 /DNA_END=1508 /DNA_ORIENTATION=+
MSITLKLHRLFLVLILVQKIQGSPFILRIRWPNGSMGKIMINEKSDSSSLRSILAGHPQYSSLLSSSNNDNNNQPFKIQDKDNTMIDDTKSLTELGLKHGSLLSIISKSSSDSKEKTSSLSARKRKEVASSFQPFPDLAKKDATRARYDMARQKKNRGVHSYTDLLDRQSNSHVVEPQGAGPIHRVYMCATSAQRFHASKNTNKVGLLFGTVQRERKEATSRRKIQTSLSSQPKAEDFCQVVKVHTIWEPPSSLNQKQTKNKVGYSNHFLLKQSEAMKRVQKVASYLGLKPIGWIFAYGDEEKELPKNNANDKTSVVITGKDLTIGAQLQIQQMQQRGREDGAKFVTLAMQASDGATEAFQISDVCVQMASEGILTPSKSNIISTIHEIVVDGKETKQLESVLCLINTALLSHEGMYVAHSEQKPTVKSKTGTLTLKIKKALLKAVEETMAKGSNDDSSLLSLLCDFPTLLALDTLLADDEQTQDICRSVSKW